jgi:hypothetical protein
VAIGAWVWQQRASTPYKELDTILAQYPGATLVQTPDKPGPYRYIGAALGQPDGAVVGAFTANGRRREFSFTGVKGSYLIVVGLEPAEDGGPTFAVLRRGVP